MLVVVLGVACSRTSRSSSPVSAPRPPTGTSPIGFDDSLAQLETTRGFCAGVWGPDLMPAAVAAAKVTSVRILEHETGETVETVEEDHYDRDGRVVSTSYASGEAQPIVDQLSYRDGRLISIGGGDGRTLHYDDLGRLVEERGNTLGEYSKRISYRAGGAEIVVSAEGEVEQRDLLVYDARGRQIEWSSRDAADRVIFHQTRRYDGDHVVAITSVRGGELEDATFTYDATGRLVDLTCKGDDHRIYSRRFLYGPDGLPRRQEIRDTDSLLSADAISKTRDYAYER